MRNFNHLTKTQRLQLEAYLKIFIIITIIEFIYILNLKDKINKNNSNDLFKQYTI